MTNEPSRSETVCTSVFVVVYSAQMELLEVRRAQEEEEKKRQPLPSEAQTGDAAAQRGCVCAHTAILVWTNVSCYEDKVFFEGHGVRGQRSGVGVPGLVVVVKVS